MRTLVEQAQAFAQVQVYLVQGATDLFAHYGVRVQHSLGSAAAEIRGPAVMAVIGYGAPTVRGALLFLTSRDVVAELQPRELRTEVPTEDLLRDVLGEFCNMAIGRVKNQLVGHAIAPLVSTPTTIFGNDLRLPAPMSGMSAWHRFASTPGDIFVRLDAAFDAEFVLGAAGSDSSPSMPEGDMVLFAE